MIGIIQRTLVECMHEIGGDTLRREIFRDAGVSEDKVFRIDQNYPDDELAALLGATIAKTGLDADAVIDLFARVFFRVVNDLFPELLARVQNSQELIRLQVKLHTLIAAGQTDPDRRQQVQDKFHIVVQGANKVQVSYRSPLQLCGLYKALAHAAANEYGDRIEIDTVCCRKRGDEKCQFAVRWMEIAGRLTSSDVLEHSMPEITGT